MLKLSTAISWEKIFAVAGAIHSCAWGIYFASTRPLVSDVLGGGYQAVSLLIGVEWGAVALALLGGYIADRFGKRLTAALGTLGTLGFIGMYLSRDVPSFLLFAFLASLLWGLSWPSVISPVLSSERIAARYGRTTAAMVAGWGVGTVVAGGLANAVGFSGALAVAGILYAIAFTLFTVFLPSNEGGECVTISRALELLKKVATLCLALIALTMGIELGLGIYTVKLYRAIHRLFGSYSYADLIYGVFFGGIPCAVGAVAKVYIGRVAEVVGYEKLLALTGVLYAATFLAMYFATDPMLIALWCLPLYSFFDVSAYSTIASRAPLELKAFSAGATLTAMSIGGGLVALSAPLVASTGIEGGTVLAVILILISIAAIVIDMKSARR